jgi:hypothetical protein
MKTPQGQRRIKVDFLTHGDATTQYARSSEHATTGAVFSVDRATQRC